MECIDSGSKYSHPSTTYSKNIDAYERQEFPIEWEKEKLQTQKDL